MGRPREDVAYCRYVFPAPPIKMEEDAMEVRPVPPYKTEMEVVAPTTPLRASRGPLRVVRVSIPAPENDDVADCPKYAVFPFTFVAKKLDVVAVFAVSVPPTMTLPAVSMEVVAVPPKYARYAESMVEEEFPNCCKAVHAFAFVRLSAREEADPPIKAPRVPVTESVPPVVREEVATDWYTLLPPYTI